MRPTLTMTMTAIAALALAAPVAAQAPRFSMSFDYGSDIALSGDVHAGGSGSVLDLPTTVGSRSYDDVYGALTSWSVSFGVWTAEQTEIRARYSRTTGEASELQVGNVAGLPLFAEFGDYTANGFDVGVRQYYGTRVQPFTGASVGVVRASAIDGTFSVPTASVTLPNIAMYDDSTVLRLAVSAGVLVPVGTNLGIQGGVDFRWMGDLDPVDGLAGTGLESINDESRRWSMPITIGAVVRF